MIWVLAVLILSLIFTRLLIEYPRVLNAIDVPNSRSLHSIPTPRTGGVAILTSLLVSGVWWLASRMETFPSDIVVIVAGAILLGIIAFWDDLRTLRPTVRLLSQSVIVVGVLYWNHFFIPESIQEFYTTATNFVLSVGIFFVVVWMINLYNFMDGMDGFAGGMAVIGFATYALIGFREHSVLYACVMAVISASSAGFLYYNFPPAKIFLGDVGSTTLGFGAAIAGLWGWERGIFSVWVPFVIFSPFILDASVTLGRRLMAGKNIFVAHREHYYQRLVQAGWGHRTTVLCGYCIMVFMSAVTLVGSLLPFAQQSAVVLIVVGLYCMLVWVIERRVPSVNVLHSC